VIIRVFKTTIHPGKEPEFEAFLRDTAVPRVSKQAGPVGPIRGQAPCWPAHWSASIDCRR
jgi:hypothetical protein